MADVADVELRLIALGEALEFSRFDTLADDVMSELDTSAAAPWRWRRPLLVAAAVLLVLATAVVAVPGSRRTVARWLGFDDLRIERVDVVPPTVTVAPTVQPPEQLTAAYERVGAAPLVAPALGAPISVETPLDRYVVVRYAEALLVTLPGRLEPDLLGKAVGTAVEVRPITLFGGEAYWISGQPHFFMYTDGSGMVQEARPSADSLVWQRGGDIVRIEGELTLERAIEIARSVRAP